MLGLIYKDFVVTRKYLFFMLAACIIIPLVLADSFGQAPDDAAPLILLVCTIYCVFFCLMDLTRKESEFHNAVALIGTTAYSRTLMVVSTYLFSFLLFAGACIVYAIEAVFIPQLREISPLAASVVFFIVALLTSILLTLIYTLGYNKTRYIFSLTILLTPFLAAYIGEHTHFPAYLQLSDPWLTAAVWGASVLILGLSILLSVRSYSRAELA